jgi:adenosylhomocysteine nucleosidase
MQAPLGSGGVTAFICAMPMELRPLARRLGLRKQRIGDLTVHSGTLAGRGVVATVTGMGTALATERTTRLLDAVPVDRVIVVGITGALENMTPIGTLVVPEVVVDSATDEELEPAPLGGVVPRGKMWTTDVLTTDPDELARLRAEGVVSLDMETAAIGRVCGARGVPWSVIRVISDRASDGSVDEEVFHMSNQDGSPNPVAVVRYFARHPGAVPRMARLAKGAKLATETAADEAIRAAARTSAPRGS